MAFMPMMLTVALGVLLTVGAVVKTLEHSRTPERPERRPSSRKPRRTRNPGTFLLMCAPAAFLVYIPAPGGAVGGSEAQALS